jgi:hypothetical protein
MNLNNVFEHELRKLILEEIERIKEILASGLSVIDYTEYKHHTGQIRALNTVLERCDEVASIISKR